MKLKIDGKFYDLDNMKVANCSCGNLLLTEQLIVTEHGAFCEFCFSHFHPRSVHDNNRYHQSLQTNSYGNYILTEVLTRDEWFLCASSHEFHPTEFRVIINDKSYHRDYVPPSHRLHDYSFRPRVRYIDTRGAKKLYFGVELEISGGGNDRRIVSKLLDTVNKTEDERLYAKSDSSVYNGFEIVSKPHSFRSLISLPWQDLLSKAVELGFDKNARSGLHVHMSKRFFGNTDYEKDKGLMKLIYLVEKFWQEMFIFSRRNHDDVRQWARPMGLRTSESPELLLDRVKSYQYSRDGRYSAVNLRNSGTAELRFFRSTLDYDTLLATYQMCFELANFANKHSLTDVVDVGWKDFVSEINQHKELNVYLQNRSLIAPTPTSLAIEGILQDF